MSESKKQSLFDRLFRRDKQEQEQEEVREDSQGQNLEEQEKSYSVETYEEYEKEYHELYYKERHIRDDMTDLDQYMSNFGEEVIRLNSEGDKKQLDKVLRYGEELQKEMDAKWTEGQETQRALEGLQESNPEFVQQYNENLAAAWSGEKDNMNNGSQLSPTSYQEFKTQMDKGREETYHLHEELDRLSDDAYRFAAEAVNLRADGEDYESVSTLIAGGHSVRILRDKNEELIAKEAELDQLSAAQPEFSKQYFDEINAKYRKVDLEKELQTYPTKTTPLDKYIQEPQEKEEKPVNSYEEYVEKREQIDKELEVLSDKYTEASKEAKSLEKQLRAKQMKSVEFDKESKFSKEYYDKTFDREYSESEMDDFLKPISDTPEHQDNDWER